MSANITPFDVFFDGKLIDTVYPLNQTADEVKRCLILHDGYNPMIEVRPCHVLLQPGEAILKTDEVCPFGLAATDPLWFPVLDDCVGLSYRDGMLPMRHKP